jgi:hypothetical protein
MRIGSDTREVLRQTAKDFGISEACLHRWLEFADVEDRIRTGVTSAEQPFSDRDWDDAHLINTAVDIHHDDPTSCSAQGIAVGVLEGAGLVLRAGPPVHDDFVDP